MTMLNMTKTKKVLK